MKTFVLFIIVLLFCSSLLHGASSQDDVKVAIIGKLSHFITWNKKSNKEKFIITVYSDESLKDLLAVKYINKTMNTKEVVVKHITDINDIGSTDILYVGNLAQEEQYKLIAYAKNNSILSVSEVKGFAQRGGVIQIYFVSQKLKLKINHQSSLDSNLKISSALLSIATIVKGES